MNLQHLKCFRMGLIYLVLFLQVYPTQTTGEHQRVKITDEDLNKCVSFAKQIVDMMQRLETNLDWSNIHIVSGSPSHGQHIDSEPEGEALKQGKAALIASKATMQLMHVQCAKAGLTHQDCIERISQLSLPPSLFSPWCPVNPLVCTKQQLNSPYYSSDGSCNSQTNYLSGSSFTGYQRLLPANYEDYIQEPRTRSTKNKHLLPSPRLVSTILCNKHRKIEDNELTLAVMQWSQFIEHDLAHTSTNEMVHLNKSIECCGSDGKSLLPRYVHPFCLPISIPDDDLFYSKYGIDCMPYVRSVIAMKSNCKFGTVDQMNQATHFLDGSQIYGFDTKKSLSLRKLRKGLLKFREVNGESFLLEAANSLEDCQYNRTSCFIAGDSRVNAQPQLTAMHILWHREHNRIASALSHLNPKWDDETLYQEARKIVIAELQHITYNEWLPAVLGKKYVAQIKSGSYSSDVDARVTNSFATAGLRFLNSLIQGKLNLYKENRNVDSTLNLKDHFFKPHVVEEPNKLDGLVRGLATQNSQKLDLDYVEDVTAYLYNGGSYGFDIMSLDIQRGRDHGLPTYSSIRHFCGLPELTSFSNLSDRMVPETVRILKKLYHTVEDIDLLVGGISEKPDGDSLLGPTLSCIVADQLERTRRGDRYFYDNAEQPKPFTKAQLGEIEKSSLARIFCDNANSVESMQPRAFKRISISNSLSSCIGTDIPFVDLKEWKQLDA